MKSCLHFVGFRGDEYSRACRVFGKPDFIHIGWDMRARRLISEQDIVVFAKDYGDPSRRSFNDINETLT